MRLEWPVIKIFAAVACAIALATLNANAQDEIKPQFEASDVLQHFETAGPGVLSVKCPEGQICLPKRASRGRCVGGKDKCGVRAKARAEKNEEGFDLLVTFELGSDRLSETSKVNLGEFARALNAPPLEDFSFDVNGHTDARGADTLNSALSERRALVVIEYLVSLGIESSRLHAQGYGESRPRVKEDPFAGENRRVEATMRTE